jgi:hypothetical protein
LRAHVSGAPKIARYTAAGDLRVIPTSGGKDQ